MLNDWMKKLAQEVENRLVQLLQGEDMPLVLRQSMEYSLMAGGKRIRPVLHLLAYRLKRDDYERAIDMACALEMIHTYSLIHDDLPALDNDDLRRGKPTCHKKFGEANAILAGDGLLNFAHEVMIRCALKEGEEALKAMACISRAAGVSGMIKGQVYDLAWEGKKLEEAELMLIHENKTGALITGSLVSGLLMAGATGEELRAIKEYGYAIGLTFQIVDDVLDVTGDAGLMGKTLGKDEAKEKTTYATLYGVQKAMNIARLHTNKAIESLWIFGERGELLKQMAQMLLTRDH